METYMPDKKATKQIEIPEWQISMQSFSSPTTED